MFVDAGDDTYSSKCAEADAYADSSKCAEADAYADSSKCTSADTLIS